MNGKFWQGKRVLVTGHTGFKGAWLSLWLNKLGAVVTGYALPPSTSPNLFELAQIEPLVDSHFGDIRDITALWDVISASRPEVVIHMAAQPIVMEGFVSPRETFEVNVMGTVNVLDCTRRVKSVRSFLNVTTDKVYRNHEWEWGYREDDELGGSDPYSGSKSCSELVTYSYMKSFFRDCNTGISTARAGNVIGGGDFSENRIIPDCLRAALKNEPVKVRMPESVRPYQHVLDALSAYVLIARCQYEDTSISGNYNVGPDENGSVTTAHLAEMFMREWGEGMSWAVTAMSLPREAIYLTLDTSRIRKRLGWKPRWSMYEAVKKTVEFGKAFRDGGNIRDVMEKQLIEFGGLKP